MGVQQPLLGPEVPPGGPKAGWPYWSPSQRVHVASGHLTTEISGTLPWWCGRDLPPGLSIRQGTLAPAQGASHARRLQD